MTDAGHRDRSARPFLSRAVLLALLAVALGAIAHANALRNPFVWDDLQGVQDNDSIESLRPAAIVRYIPTRPIVNFSYAIDYRIWGGRNPFGFHVTNLALHLADIALLFGFTWLPVARDLGRARRIRKIAIPDPI